MFLDNIKYLVLLLALTFPGILWGQTTTVKGIVLDAKTKAPMSFVTVYFPNTTSGGETDDKGNFEISTTENATQIEASFVGYHNFKKKITPGTDITLKIELKEEMSVLEEVTVKAVKERYRNKNNPAVDLIRKVIENKNNNRLSSYQTLSFKEYEKIQFGMSNTFEKLHKNRLVKKYPFLNENIDTGKLSGKAVLPLYMEEVVAENYKTSTPDRSKKIITGKEKISFDEDFFDNQSFGSYLKYVYQPIDIYDGNIMVATNQFLSPVAELAPTFYKYYIVDTLEINGDKFIDLLFSPRNKADFLFLGNMLITLDGNYAIAKANLTVSKNVNLNWIKMVRIAQEFQKNESGKYIITKSSMVADFGITKNSDGGLYGERTVAYTGYKVDEKIADSIFKGESVHAIDIANKRDDIFWEENRLEPIHASENTVYRNIDSLQRSRSFKRTMNLITLAFAGYAKVSDYVEIGPANTFYSFNPVEGFRLRFGGRTTQKLSKYLYLEGYGAYGFKDQKWKYYIGGTYSLTGNDRFSFPTRGFNINYQQDTKIPGQELQFIQEDNFLLSFKRGVNDKWLYNNIFNLEYYSEHSNNISYKIGYKNWRQQAAGGLHYVSDAARNNVENITTSEFFAEFKWAPHQEFFQGKEYRIPFPNKYPVFTFKGAVGIKDFLGGEYDYQRLNLNIYKRFFFSQLGYTDMVVEGSYTFGKVPYPLLDIHRANQTYAYQLQSYNLMNFLEFVSDHFASVQMEHTFNGFFFNKIPLVKKLKFREYVSFKLLYGGLRTENMPTGTNDGILAFPVDEWGQQTTFTFDKEPYMEGSVGIGNIFKFFRVDLVKRFSYLHHPNVAEWGVRVRFKFDF